MTADHILAVPQMLPITTLQFATLVDQGAFDDLTGQIELINGRIVRMNPQGPSHSDPIDELAQWSFQQAGDKFRIRIEKPIQIDNLRSTPEPDLAWVTRRRYADRHPTPEDISLLIEVSFSSQAFDRGEKLQLYALAGIVEYWLVSVPDQTIEVFTSPHGSSYQKSQMLRVGDEVSPGCLPTAILPIARLFSNQVD